VLEALTDEASRAVPSGMLVGGMVGILRFPFRVGRESRVRVFEGKNHRMERPRLGGAEPTNDLYLLDAGTPLQISREHFLIDRIIEGYQLVDRGSACGTSVEGVRVGGKDAGGKLALRDGDILVIGDGPTPFRYRFIALE
jgi:pSer/pThr/pTyr-binding forkhead associated (FHA) protein